MVLIQSFHFIINADSLSYLARLAVLQYKLVNLLEEVLGIPPIVFIEDSIACHSLTQADRSTPDLSITALHILSPEQEQTAHRKCPDIELLEQVTGRSVHALGYLLLFERCREPFGAVSEH